MIKKNNSENIFRLNLPKKKKSTKRIYKSKSKYDLRRKENNFIKNKDEKIKSTFNLNEYKFKIGKYLLLTSHIKNNDNNSSQNEKSINKSDVSEDIFTRKRILNYLNLSKRLIDDKKQNSPIFLNINIKQKILNVKKEKEKEKIKNYSYDLKKRILTNSNEKRKSTKISILL